MLKYDTFVYIVYVCHVYLSFHPSILLRCQYFDYFHNSTQLIASKVKIKLTLLQLCNHCAASAAIVHRVFSYHVYVCGMFAYYIYVYVCLHNYMVDCCLCMPYLHNMHKQSKQ